MDSEGESTKRILRCTRYKNLIVDVGGVLLQMNLDVSDGTTISPNKFKRMLRSSVWYSYLMGKISSDEAMSRLSVEMDCSAELLRQFCRNKRAALVPIMEIVQLIERLELNLYAMTNCPAEDAQELQNAFPDIFVLFKQIFTSSAAGMRKPNLNFFKHVLSETGIVPSETVFLDDDLANILAAESLGITSILVPSTHGPNAIAQTVKQVVSTLRTEEEQLSAAREYMLNHRGVYKSLALTGGGLRVPVLFDHFIIADLLDDELYLPIGAPPARGTINCFPDSEISAKSGWTGEEMAFIQAFNLPDDADTTCIGLAVLHRFSKADLPLINTVLDKMERELRSEDGMFEVYFDPRRRRVDPVSIINTLHLCHLAGRGGTSVAKTSEEFVLNVLQNRGYKRGTPYYRAPEAFLVQLARLVFNFKAYFEKAGFVDILRNRVVERMGMEGDALALAMRVLACNICGMPNSCSTDLEHLMSLQNVDGSWGPCPFYHQYNVPNAWFGNESITTAFAIAAIEGQKNPTTYGKCLKQSPRSKASGASVFLSLRLALFQSSGSFRKQRTSVRNRIDNANGTKRTNKTESEKGP